MQIHTVDKYGGYSESTEPIDAVNISPLARFESTTSTTPPSTTPDIDATNCATETSPKKDVQVADQCSKRRILVPFQRLCREYILNKCENATPEFIVGVCNCYMFCCPLLCVCSSIAIILMGK